MAVALPTVHALSHIIASMKGLDGQITIDGFYDDVVELTIEDREAIARVPFDEDEYAAKMGVPEPFGEAGYTVAERLWARPTLELNGIWGGYQGSGTKTVIPSQAHAKIACRLVADQSPEEIVRLIRAHVETHTPPSVTVEVDRLPATASAFMPKGIMQAKLPARCCGICMARNL